jgi:hypothetical protein
MRRMAVARRVVSCLGPGLEREEPQGDKEGKEGCIKSVALALQA